MRGMKASLSAFCMLGVLAGSVRAVEGGTVACEEAGLPINRSPGAGAISLERQVRIVAGTLTLAGAILAWLVHPAFLIVPGFIGAGLAFAGITNSCGMAMVLARMPWNCRP